MGYKRESQISGSGWLYELDPRPKLLLVPIIAPALFIYEINPFGIVVLVALHFLLLSSGLAIKRIGEIWKSLLLVNILIIGFAALPFSEGWLPGLYRALRIDALSFLFWLPLLTTTPHQLRRGAEKLGLPHALGLMVEIAVNFLPEIKQQIKTIEEATYCRGYAPTHYSWHRRIINKLPQLLALMVSAIRRSESLGRILETRGYGIIAKQSTYRDIRLRKQDIFILTGEMLFFAGLYLYPQFTEPLMAPLFFHIKKIILLQISSFNLPKF